MPKAEPSLIEVYASPPVKAFGRALRYALWRDGDYASLIEFENAESPTKFADAVRKFLRRYRSGAYMSEELRKRADLLRKQNRWDALRHLLRQNKIGPRPSDADLEELMGLAAGEARTGVVTAALISYGLTKGEPAREIEEAEKEAS